jgi:hypothetical protein
MHSVYDKVKINKGLVILSLIPKHHHGHILCIPVIASLQLTSSDVNKKFWEELRCPVSLTCWQELSHMYDDAHELIMTHLSAG